jgi:RDD family
MSDGLIAIGGISPGVLLRVLVGIALIAAVLLALAPMLSTALLRFRARRLPAQLSERLLEEWLAEVHSIEDRFGKLTFAIALAFTRTHSLVQDADEAPVAVADLLDFADVKVPADFGIRLFALAVDQAITWAAFKGSGRLVARMPASLAVQDFLIPVLWIGAMQVYFVQRFNGSPGKLLAKLRIVTMNGSPLTYKHAFLRAAPGLFVAFVGIMFAVMFFSTISHAD